MKNRTRLDISVCAKSAITRSKYYHVLCYGTLVLSTAFAVQVSAIPLNLDAERQVQVGDQATGAHVGALGDSTAVGLFSDSVSQNLGGTPNNSAVTTTATQNSNIAAAAGLFAGDGTAHIDFSAAPATGVFAQSFFDVFFDLTTPHAYALKGFLKTNNDGGLAQALFQLGIDGAPLLLDLASFNFDNQGKPVDISSSGILAPGTYELFALSQMSDANNGFYGGDAAFNFTLQLTDLGRPLPEPATNALLGLAVCGLMWRRGWRSKGELMPFSDEG